MDAANFGKVLLIGYILNRFDTNRLILIAFLVFPFGDAEEIPAIAATFF